MAGALALIVVVDDEGVVRDVVERILGTVGFRVVTAEDGAKALGIIRQRATEISLVISDIEMPGMGGLELIEHLRREGITVPVLFMSGSCGKFERELRSAPYIAKPFTRAQLIAMVRRIILKPERRRRPAPRSREDCA